MYKQYIKQAFHLLRENMMLSIITIIGTALAVSIIMVIIILARAKTANYEPEVNRDRSLYVSWGSAVQKDSENNRNHSRLSYYDIREAFYPLRIPEAVSATYEYGSMLLSVPGSQEVANSRVVYTDAAFWKVYQFNFLAGRPFSQEIFQSGIKQAVINESTARQLYGSVELAVGKRVDLNYVEFTVCGVVKDVSKFAELSYADVWLPYTTNSQITRINTQGWGNGHTGGFKCVILARTKGDFPAIKEELAQSIARMNANSPSFYLDIDTQPMNFNEQLTRKFANGGSTYSQTIIRYLIVIFIILLVPAINLSSLTMSRMRKRLPEMGVRKAFGAGSRSLLHQVLFENFILTLIGGIVGLLFSYLAIWLLSDWLLASDLGGVATMHTSMISFWIFLVALVFCLLLNLLSAGIPAWRVTRTAVVNALNDK